MKQRDVVFSPEAESDLIDLFDFIAMRADIQTAQNYVSRIETFCMELDLASERGILRDDVRKGLRILGFERRLTVAFTVERDRVTILRFFTAGQNWEASGW